MRRFLLLGVLLFNFALAQLDSFEFNNNLLYNLEAVQQECSQETIDFIDDFAKDLNTELNLVCFYSPHSVDLVRQIIKNSIDLSGESLEILQSWEEIGGSFRFRFLLAKHYYLISLISSDTYLTNGAIVDGIVFR